MTFWFLLPRHGEAIKISIEIPYKISYCHMLSKIGYRLGHPGNFRPWSLLNSQSIHKVWTIFFHENLWQHASIFKYPSLATWFYGPMIQNGDLAQPGSMRQQTLPALSNYAHELSTPKPTCTCKHFNSTPSLGINIIFSMKATDC